MHKTIFILLLSLVSCSKEFKSAEPILMPSQPKPNDLINIYVKAKAYKGTFNLTISQNYISNGSVYNKILGGGNFSDTLNFDFRAIKGDSIWVQSMITKNPIYMDTKLEYSISTDSLKLYEYSSFGAGIFNGWVYVK
jgi:hypothetical protein